MISYDSVRVFFYFFSLSFIIHMFIQGESGHSTGPTIAAVDLLFIIRMFECHSISFVTWGLLGCLRLILRLLLLVDSHVLRIGKLVRLVYGLLHLDLLGLVQRGEELEGWLVVTLLAQLGSLSYLILHFLRVVHDVDREDTLCLDWLTVWAVRS